MTLETLYLQGAIKFMFDKGLISPKIMSYFEYRETFMKYRVTMSYREACERTATTHRVSIETVKRAIKVLKQ